MVVRLKEGQFTAGDMVIAVRSRRRARADPRFYGENVGKQPVEKKKVVPLTETVSDKVEKFKESDEYFNPVTMVVQEEEVRQSKESNLNERARKILADIEEDMRKINMKQSLKRGL